MSIQDLYNSIFSLYSDELSVRDNIGGVTRILSLKQGNIPCYITYIGGQEQYTPYGKNNVIADYRLFCDPIEVKSTDVVRIVDDDGDNQYNILYIDDCDDLQHHFEIDLLLIKAPLEIDDNNSSSSESMSESSSSSSTVTRFSTSSASSSSSSTVVLSGSSSSSTVSESSSSEIESHSSASSTSSASSVTDPVSTSSMSSSSSSDSSSSST